MGVFLDLLAWARQGKIRIRHRTFRISHWRFHKGNEKFHTQQDVSWIWNDSRTTGEDQNQTQSRYDRIRFCIRTWNNNLRAWYEIGSGQSPEKINIFWKAYNIMQKLLQFKMSKGSIGIRLVPTVPHLIRIPQHCMISR